MNPLLVFAIVLAAAVLLRLVVPPLVRVIFNYSVRDLRALTSAFEARMLPYMQANYPGDPAQLEVPVRGLLTMAREVANQQRDPVPEDILHTMIVTALAHHGFARRERAQAALDAVLRDERMAA